MRTSDIFSQSCRIARTALAEQMPHPSAGSSPGANLSVSPREPAPGSSARVSLTLVADDGLPVTSLELLHTKPVHLIAVSEDLQDFIHVHPEGRGRNRFEAAITFAQPSNYRLWTEYQPTGSPKATLDVADVATRGAMPTMVLPVVDSHEPKTVSGVRARLRGAEGLKAGRLANLHLELTDSRGRPLRVEPFLGAPGHAILVSSDRTEFMHLHGESPGSAGLGAGHGGDAGATGGVTFETRLPAPGLYKAFFQVSVGGQVVTIPYGIRVTA